MGATLFKMTVGCIALENYNVISLGRVDSTQTYAHDLIARGAARDKTAVLAVAQTAGRGRYSRTWVSESGNLYTSLIWACAAPDPRLSYAVAVAVAEVLRSHGIKAAIKWPNDILVDGKKICGILIEYVQDFVVVGIGINIVSCPGGLAYGTTCVHEFAPDVTRDDVMARLVRALDKWRVADFADVRAQWTAWAVGVHKMVTYRGENMELLGINENGALMLRHGEKYILAWGDEIQMA
ncbi:biotin--[acetyl-CoA-carboxylase] ligase [bacterium]|nr:biotin--[acetyl-CoA-carboxylase] ligase [bacterium]